MNSNSWNDVSNAILNGICHHLGNRVAFFSGLAEIIARNDSLPPVFNAVTSEVSKLEQGVRALQLMLREDQHRGERHGERLHELKSILTEAAQVASMHPAVCHQIRLEVDNSPAVFGQAGYMMRKTVFFLVSCAQNNPDDELVVKFSFLGDNIKVYVEGDSSELLVFNTSP